MKRLLIFLMLALVVFSNAYSEEDQLIPMIVTGSNLNCRMAANKHSYIVTELEKGQEIQSTGRWSKNHRWVEICHPEYGNLWCSYEFVTERIEPFTVETLWDEPIKIRKQPVDGRISGYLRKGRTVEITQVVLGWGKCAKGWIDLSYCIETEE